MASVDLFDSRNLTSRKWLSYAADQQFIHRTCRIVPGHHNGKMFCKRLVLTSTSQHGKSNREPNSVAPSAVKPRREILDSAMNYARRRALQSTCPTSVMTAVISSAPLHLSNLNSINIVLSGIITSKTASLVSVCQID
ncbi:hypothetical protein Tsp_04878 [Trichinella spiralis]|uniref:hypothetical protein n=1 Tax=Trichinella spiralis TaxID=6334 RepID=UPI0001EFE38B|nr:hypothetical protein Tsp_04878 [Trichinella spiralis]